MRCQVVVSLRSTAEVQYERYDRVGEKAVRHHCGRCSAAPENPCCDGAFVSFVGIVVRRCVLGVQVCLPVGHAVFYLTIV
eukprot:1880405-Pleurochrysis_carterae.AAC.1